MDAASRTKVDDTRELLDNVQYAPTRGRYKVYLIDEVHMLSTHSFNALLKTLEEPPPHVKFLLATTDPQKLPVTVLSRCLQFNLKRLPVAQIAERMKHDSRDRRHCRSMPAGVRLVAQAADGSMRDGLSLLDQLIAFGGGKVTEEAARAMLGTVARDHVVRLAELLATADARALDEAMRSSLDEWAPDYAQVLDELAALLARVAMKQIVQAITRATSFIRRSCSSGSRRAFAPEDVQLFYQTAIIGRRDLPLAPEPRVGFRDDAAAHAGVPARRRSRAGAMRCRRRRHGGSRRSAASAAAAPAASDHGARLQLAQLPRRPSRTGSWAAIVERARSAGRGAPAREQLRTARARKARSCAWRSIRATSI